MSLDFEQLEIVHLSRFYGRRKALADVSLTCRAGEIVGLLGPNGAGKSTLLSIVSTLVMPSRGEVRYGGQTAAALGPALRARVGVLAHDLHLYPELSARENLTFFGELYGLDAIPDRVRRSLEHGGLVERADDPLSAFSRGMRQRLALERCLLHEPRLVLLDEPFTGLDDASGRALIARLRILRARGTIVLLATHDLDLAETVLDRAVVLQRGRITALADGAGSLRDRYRRTLHDAGDAA